ncbi:hypothetical protein [Mycoplasmopsis verecunda]|uniref:Uncharacterized protein n=1 Tax=Mycoplasmopsis verecunda TaxID=171291 RepID=A0A1T4LTF9_9BACT|nr:hypothetical protein [Mycoplasmopsis verecunda]WPB54565.1 hypothetical protein SAM46_00125 [Mycoplasmopsis verecunda]SJZ57911.1 hypothetical protein SAMN02745154_00530 [Mycoplasmopsis verecunda]
MIVYTNDTNYKKSTDQDNYLIYSYVVNLFYSLPEEYLNDFLTKINLTVDELNNTLPNWIKFKNKDISKSDKLAIIEFNKFLIFLADELEKINRKNNLELHSYNDDSNKYKYKKVTSIFLSALFSYMQYMAKTTAIRMAGSWLSWVSLILTLKDVYDFEKKYSEFDKLIKKSNKFYDLNFNLSMSVARFFSYIKDNPDNTINTYLEKIERLDKILTNIKHMSLFLDKENISYNKNSDILFGINTLKNIFSDEKNNIISEMNKEKNNTVFDDDFGPGY